ncbi:MAG: diacylglycerol kinase family protein [Chloroflexota bacterium]
MVTLKAGRQEALPEPERPREPEGARASGQTRRILVVRNGQAGQFAALGRTPDRAMIESALRRHGITAEVFDSESEADTARRVDQAVAERFDAIVAAGGDGTVESVALRLIDTETALAVLPLGTAQNIARSIGIPRDLDGAAALVADGTVRRMDIGEVHTPAVRPFLGAVSIGLTAEILAQGGHLDEGRYGAFLATLRRAVRREAVRIDVELDGRRIEARAIGLVVANAPYTGLAISVAPDAGLDDHQLDVVIFEGFSRWGLLRYLLRRLWGRRPGGRKPAKRGILMLRGRNVRVTARHPLAVRVDSNDLGTTPVEVGVRPGALRVIAPVLAQDSDHAAGTFRTGGHSITGGGS